MFISLIIVTIVTLTVVNLNMNMSIHAINNVKLSAAESFAEEEIVFGTHGMRLESYLCRETADFQRICETFTRYSSYCSKSDETTCPDGKNGSGSNWNNPDQTWKP